jgi:hypothetical protein
MTECGGDTPSRQCYVDPRRCAQAGDSLAEYAQGFKDGQIDCASKGYD